jgi:hypothetical protein
MRAKAGWLDGGLQGAWQPGWNPEAFIPPVTVKAPGCVEQGALDGSETQVSFGAGLVGSGRHA